MNKENPCWRCPHCNESTTPEHLRRDEFFDKLYKDVGRNVVEVEFIDSCDHYQISKVETPEPGDESVDGDITAKVEDSNSGGAKDGVSQSNSSISSRDAGRNIISLLSDDEDEDSGTAPKRARLGEPSDPANTSTTQAQPAATQDGAEANKSTTEEFQSTFASMSSTEMLNNVIAFSASSSQAL